MVYELYNEKLLYLYKLAREIFGINLFGMIFFFFYVYLNMNINYNWKNVEKLVHDPILLLFSLSFFFFYIRFIIIPVNDPRHLFRIFIVRRRVINP